jgi:hypothetical protein
LSAPKKGTICVPWADIREKMVGAESVNGIEIQFQLEDDFNLIRNFIT